MNKGHAFGFFIVLLVLVLGMYVAYTSFVSSREALRARPTLPPSTNVGQGSQSPGSSSLSPMPTLSAPLTPTLQITISLPSTTPTVTFEPPPASEPPAPQPPATEPPAPPPTEPPLPPATDTPEARPQPPTPAPAPAYLFRLAGPPAADPNFPNCCYLFGTVRDAAGNGLEGVLVQARNEWNTLPPAATKGGGELGQYNIPIGRDVVTWDLVIVDGAGNQISTKVQINWDPNVANGFRIDWQRTR